MIWQCCNLSTQLIVRVYFLQGCKVRDHIVSLESANNDPQITKVYDDLLEHRDMICVSFHRPLAEEEQ